MNDNYNQTLDFGGVFSGDVIDMLPDKKRGISNWLTTRQGNAIAQRARLEIGHDTCRLAYTASVLQHVGMLTMAEEQFTHLAPRGAERYRSIVDSYTRAAIRSIEHF